MKQEFFILSLLIPAQKSPGNNIDIFLQPFIEELNELWRVGIETYDAFAKETFQMRATLMWTRYDLMEHLWSICIPFLQYKNPLKNCQPWKEILFHGASTFIEVLLEMSQ